MGKLDKNAIRSSLLLRWLNAKESFTHQWLMAYPNDHHKILELINIKKQKFSLESLIKAQEEKDFQTSSRGKGTIRGFRAKNNKKSTNPKGNNNGPYSTKFGSR